jgi:hypothetical protein
VQRVLCEFPFFVVFRVWGENVSGPAEAFEGLFGWFSLSLCVVRSEVRLTHLSIWLLKTSHFLYTWFSLFVQPSSVVASNFVDVEGGDCVTFFSLLWRSTHKSYTTLVDTEKKGHPALTRLKQTKGSYVYSKKGLLICFHSWLTASARETRSFIAAKSFGQEWEKWHSHSLGFVNWLLLLSSLFPPLSCKWTSFSSCLFSWIHFWIEFPRRSPFHVMSLQRDFQGSSP